jgi:predicted nucleic acid-binding protein
LILLDASVMVAYLRRRDPGLAQAMGELELGLCGVTRAEILHGARDEEDWRKLVALLDQFAPIEIPEDLWDDVGQRLFELRRRGIVIPFTDVVVATLALARDFEIWAFDKHFPLMAGVFPLRLYVRPGLADVETQQQ